MAERECFLSMRADTSARAGEPLTGWRVFPLPLTNLESLRLPDVSGATTKTAAPGPAPAAAASLGATASFAAQLQHELALVAQPGLPAIEAVLASDGGAACPAPPAGSGSGSPPSPATAGPTFYQCGPQLVNLHLACIGRSFVHPLSGELASGENSVHGAHGDLLLALALVKYSRTPNIAGGW